MPRFWRIAIRSFTPALAALSVIFAVTLASMAPSAAQQAPGNGNGNGNGNGPPQCNPGKGKGDPYSCNTTTTAKPHPAPHLVLSLHIGPPNSIVNIQVCCVESGQPITVTLGGVTVLSDTAQPGVGAALGAVHAAPSHPFAAISPLALLRALGVGARPHVRPEVGVFDSGINDHFTVPDIAPGTYDICASTPGFPPGCDTFTVTAKATVLGEQILRGGQTGGQTGGSVSATRQGGVGTLARTGLEVLLFVLVAVGLLVMGRFLVVASRRSSRR